MEKNLQQLLSAITVLETAGPADRPVSGVASDSRKVEPGNLFVAVRGTQVDGHQYIQQAIDRGAVAVVCEEMPRQAMPGVTYVRTPRSASALGWIASEWYDRPSEQMRLVGVTGTNGKTTTATLLYELMRYLGYKAGLLSTVCNYVDGRPSDATQTTPDPLTLNNLLSQMVEAGCDYAFMEVSSHAADQCRIDGLHFAGGIFTNLTRDHLDYHKTVDAYIKAKKRFFDLLPADAFALVNADDKVGEVMLQNTKAGKYAYSLTRMADFSAKILEMRLDGMTLLVDKWETEVMFTGRFNAYNLLAVYSAARLLGFEPAEVLQQMSRLVPVAGRFQTLHSTKGYSAVVDYAHTPDALSNVLKTLREVLGYGHRIITVVGCGGNRDKGKRPIMADMAVRLSDYVVFTSDNPRFEKPEDILNDMTSGLGQDSAPSFEVEPDRHHAIARALSLAEKSDVVLIAGKGHESYQEICGVKHHFSDCEEVTKWFDSERDS